MDTYLTFVLYFGSFIALTSLALGLLGLTPTYAWARATFDDLKTQRSSAAGVALLLTIAAIALVLLGGLVCLPGFFILQYRGLINLGVPAWIVCVAFVLSALASSVNSRRAKVRKARGEEEAPSHLQPVAAPLVVLMVIVVNAAGLHSLPG